MTTVYKSPLSYNEVFQEVTFTHAFFKCIESFDTKTALIDPDDGRTISFNDLPLLVQKYKNGIAQHGLVKGTTVATICGNSLNYLLFCLASLDLGIVLVPINPASKEREIAKFLVKCSVDTIVVDAAIELKSKVVLLNEMCSEDIRSHPGNYAVQEDDKALIFFSSGTTGPPKAIVHSHRSSVAHLNQRLAMEQSDLFPRVTANDTIHGILPYFHFGGLMTTFLMLSTGATLVINKRWNESGYLKILQDYKVTITNVVPPILTFLAHSPLIDDFNLELLRRIYVGAAVCEVSVMNLVKERLPNAEITQLFGMTEAGLAILMSPEGHTNYSTSGIPLPGVECRVDEEGELEVKAPTLMKGYLGFESIPFEDWFKTGDLATVTSCGNFTISGRKKDTFKVRGWQVNPWELEEAIKALPGVIDCAVVGVPHEADGHRPKAFVVGRVEPKEVEDFVKENFISYKRLETSVIVDALPRNASGKLLRRELQ